MPTRPIDDADRQPRSANCPHPARRGVVGVITRDEQLLVIRRSIHVRAPGKFCFPGGGIEARESEPEALARELVEELNLEARPLRRLWESATEHGTRLGWWLVDAPSLDSIAPNPREVAEIHWLTVPAILELDGLLDSNRRFFLAWLAGSFTLPISPLRDS